MDGTRVQIKTSNENRYLNIDVGDLKLINSRWEIETDKISKILGENSEYLVIGIIGGPGRGKSTLLNKICGFKQDDPPVSSPFPVQPLNSQLENKHCTTGIDIRISRDRIIALDSHPVCSLSVLYELLTRPFPCMELARMMSVTTARGSRPPRTSAEAIYKTMALQMTCFLFTVCHVVIFMCEGLNDTDVLELLEGADLFAPSIALTAGSLMIPQNKLELKISWHLGEGILLFQNVKMDELDSQNIHDLEKRLKLRFKNSKLLNKNTISCWKGTPLANYIIESENENNKVAVGGDNGSAGGDEENRISLFVLPKYKNVVQDNSNYPITSLYEAMLESFCRQIRQYPSRKFCTNFTERQWLDWCNKVWEFVLKSKDISEYFFRLQLSVFKNGGGW